MLVVLRRRGMSILQYNGGCCIAMAGNNCFAIASDRRFGVQQMTVSCDYSKVRTRVGSGVVGCGVVSGEYRRGRGGGGGGKRRGWGAWRRQGSGSSTAGVYHRGIAPLADTGIPAVCAVVLSPSALRCSKSRTTFSSECLGCRPMCPPCACCRLACGPWCSPGRGSRGGRRAKHAWWQLRVGGWARSCKCAGANVSGSRPTCTSCGRGAR